MAKIACASITWGDLKTSADAKHMLSDMQSCGYDGVETGSNALDLLSPEDFKAYRLKLVAVHTGGDYRAIEDAAVRDKFSRLAERASGYGAEFVFISGAFYAGKSADDYYKDAEKYNVAGKAVKECGLQLCYHNHAFEFKKNRMGLTILTRETDADCLGLVPDLGWVYRGDMEPVDFLKAFGERVKALHMKEFTFDDRFTELGKGVVDFAPAYEYAKARDLWLVAEQDVCDGKPVDSARQNAEYLFRLTGRT